LSEAVNLHASLQQFNFEAYALRALGTTYQALGELDRADEYLRQALEKSADDGRVRAAVLAGLGTVAYQRAEYEQALDWHQRSVDSTTSAVDRAYRRAFVVRDLVALQRFDEAVAAGAAVLASADTPAITRADVSLELGHAYLGLDQSDGADEHFLAALAVYDAGGITTKQAEALKGRALVARVRGNLRDAIEFGERSLQRIETLRASVSVPELRAFYAAAHSDYYESQIESLIDAHRLSAQPEADRLADSLSVSERARARVIVDLLNEASVRVDRDRPEAAVRRERQLYDELGALRLRRDQVLEQPNAEIAQLEPLVRRMAAIENELSVSATEARRDNDGRASAVAAVPLSAAQIQEQLDARSVLLQYALGSPRSFAWVVTRDSLQVVELGDREAIESAARRVYENLKTYRSEGSSDTQATLLDELSGLVLAPVAPFIGAGRQRVIVAADGALGYIPFAVLPFARAGDGAPLLDAFEVVNVPSMSAAAAQRRRVAAVPPKTLAVFADPVFAATDPRLGSGLPDLASRLVSPAAQLERLPATGAEADAIAALVAPESRLVVLGFDANREHVLDAPLSDYRIVHFATHGLVDSRYPGLSALAFSQFDMAGRPRDGMLRLQDVYSLDLNADFVVLSGCETALGREIRGEGLIGLANGFLYAGARNLVVSLWQVPDRATAELMTRFYGHVLRDALSPAEALRRAQRSIAAERRWSDPYFWGAFVVLGSS
jgi:CHAT domain-containing protein